MEISRFIIAGENLSLRRATQYFDPAQHKTESPNKRESGGKKIDNDSLRKLKETLAENNITLKFSRDESTRAIIVELVDGQTGEAIRQIPSTVSLRLAAHFVKLQGQFIDTQE
jgi:uncharacterized FlaG/YvyC family protein